MFFNQEQFKMTEAAAERIYPEDENGPGAKALGVAFLLIISSQDHGDITRGTI